MGKNKIKFYNINYLIDEELTDDDLYYLFDTKSLLYSLIVGMYKSIGCNKSPEKIIRKCKNDDKWFEHTSWTRQQYNDYFEKLVKVYKNLYQYSETKCVQLSEWWMIQYGLNVKN